MQMITSTVQPASWEDSGGPGSIQPFTTGEALVISQKQAVHGELDELFVKLRAEVSNDAGEKLPGSVFLRGGSVAMLFSCWLGR